MFNFGSVISVKFIRYEFELNYIFNGIHEFVAYRFLIIQGHRVDDLDVASLKRTTLAGREKNNSKYLGLGTCLKGPTQLFSKLSN